MPRWYLVKFDVDGERRIYQHDHLTMLIEEGLKWKDGRNKTEVRDGKRLDYWYSGRNTEIKKFFPKTGLVQFTCNWEKQWQEFCKPFVPKMLYVSKNIASYF